MKIKIKRDDLLSVLRMPSEIASNYKDLNPILGYIHLEIKDGIMSCVGTDIVTTAKCTATVEDTEDIDLLIDGSGLFKMVSMLGEYITLKDNKKTTLIEVSSGKVKFDVKTMKTVDFPQAVFVDDDKFISFDAKLLDLVLSKTQSFFSESETHPSLNGVFIDLTEGGCMGIGSNRETISIVEYSIDHKLGDIDFIIPGSTVGRLRKVISGLKEVDIYIGKDASKRSNKTLHVRHGNLHYKVSLVDSKYPIRKNILPPDLDTFVEVDKNKFLEKFKYIKFMASKGEVLLLEVKNGNMNFSIVNPSKGAVTVDMDVDYEGEDIVMGFNPSFLELAVGNISTGLVQLHFHDSMLKVLPHGGSSETMVVAPINIRK